MFLLWRTSSYQLTVPWSFLKCHSVAFLHENSQEKPCLLWHERPELCIQQILAWGEFYVTVDRELQQLSKKCSIFGKRNRVSTVFRQLELNSSGWADVANNASIEFFFKFAPNAEVIFSARSLRPPTGSPKTDEVPREWATAKKAPNYDDLWVFDVSWIFSQF